MVCRLAHYAERAHPALGVAHHTYIEVRKISERSERIFSAVHLRHMGFSDIAHGNWLFMRENGYCNLLASCVSHNHEETPASINCADFLYRDSGCHRCPCRGVCACSLCTLDVNTRLCQASDKLHQAVVSPPETLHAHLVQEIPEECDAILHN